MKEHIQNNRTRIMESMTKAGILTATISYEGSGDSGFVEEVNLLPQPEFDAPSVEFTQERRGWIKGKATIEFSTHTESLENALTALTYQLLEELHPGWEINEGSSGIVEIDRTEDVVRVEHSQFYSSSTNYYYEL